MEYNQQITTVLFVTIASGSSPLLHRPLKCSNKMYRIEKQNDPTDMKNKRISLSDRFSINRWHHRIERKKERRASKIITKEKRLVSLVQVS